MSATNAAIEHMTHDTGSTAMMTPGRYVRRLLLPAWGNMMGVVLRATTVMVVIKTVVIRNKRSNLEISGRTLDSPSLVSLACARGVVNNNAAPKENRTPVKNVVATRLMTK
jgi:hypothetical protein